MLVLKCQVDFRCLQQSHMQHIWEYSHCFKLLETNWKRKRRS